jgi:archaellum component FlaC
MAIDKQTIDFLNYRIQALEKEVERLTKENNKLKSENYEHIKTYRTLQEVQAGARGLF